MQTFISSVHLFLSYRGNINCPYFKALKSQLKYLNYLGFVSGKQVLRKTSTPMSLCPSPHVKFHFFFLSCLRAFLYSAAPAFSCGTQALHWGVQASLQLRRVGSRAQGLSSCGA